MRAALLAAAGTLVLMATACSANGTTASGNQPGTSASPAASGAAGEGGIGGAGDTGTGNTGNGGSATNSPTPKSSTSKVAGPQIVSFVVEGNASCFESGPNFQSPGTVTLKWTVIGATKVALSIDDPTFFSKNGSGSYESNLPASHEETLNFSCNSGNGVTTTHTYTIDTMDGGSHRSKTISASATNHQ
jgi:hypothetical protein